jgi:GTP cyclohydrolase IA
MTSLPMRSTEQAHDRALGVVPASPQVDLTAAELAAGGLLRALGIATEGESMLDTHARVARAYAELFTAEAFAPTTFPTDEGYDELVLARSIPFRSVCEHHMVPFVESAHAGYLPGERILGLSKLARAVGYFAARPQVQERLTKRVADWLQETLRPAGVGVVIEAEYTCMTLRGVRAPGSTTVCPTRLSAARSAEARLVLGASAGVWSAARPVAATTRPAGTRRSTCARSRPIIKSAGLFSIGRYEEVVDAYLRGPHGRRRSPRVRDLRGLVLLSGSTQRWTADQGP